MPARNRGPPSQTPSSTRPSRPRRRAPKIPDMPFTWESPVAGGWGQPADWGAPSPAVNVADAEWAAPPTGVWGAEANWEISETVSPYNENQVFSDRWQAAGPTLVNFWMNNVSAASRDEPVRCLSDFLDELEASKDNNLWRGMRAPHEKWAIRIAGLDELPVQAPQRGESEWGSELHSRPRTPSANGKEREKSKARKLALLDRKGIFWEEPDLNGPPPTTPESGGQSSDTAFDPIYSSRAYVKRSIPSSQYVWGDETSDVDHEHNKTSIK
jgi:hypothetical protein